MKKLYPFITVLFCYCITNAQTLVNRAWLDTTGHPAVNINYQSLAKDNSYVFVAGTSYELGVGDKFYVKKLNFYGAVQWNQEYNLASYNSDVATDLYIKGSSVYVTGTTWDSVNNKSKYLTVKLNYSDGSLVWFKQDTGAAGGYAAAIAVKVDDAGNVYVAGSEKANTSDYQMTLMKYNSSGTRQWVSHYDSVGFYDAATAMILKTGLVEVTGFSGNGFSSWDFVTCRFNDTTGALTYTARSGNGNGSFSQPVGIAQDYSSNTIICGTATIAGANTDIKIIKYDTVFNEIWVKKWGNADSLADVAASMERDAYSNYAVTGTVTKTNGGKDIVTLRYDANGNLLWSRTISAPDPTKQAIANKLTTDAALNIYVTGKIFNGTDYDFVTASYDASGNMRWYKTYDGGSGYNDEGFNLVADGSGNVFVSGKSVKDTVSHFVTMKYEQLNLSAVAQNDTAGNPLYLKNQIIFKIDSAAVIRSAVDDMKINFGIPSTFFHQWAIDSLKRKFHDIEKCKVARIFMGLKTTDTISISRLGERIPIPDFWSTFLLVYNLPYTTDKKICDSLNQLFPFVEIAELDGMATISSSSPNDYYYSNFQYSLHPQYPIVDSLVDINVEPAWNYTTGKAHIKVGVFDTGLLKTHQDFYGSYDWVTSTGVNPIVKGGWDYVWDKPLGAPGYLLDYGGHGTAMAGIIGAGRNNSIGIAGIAGGDSTLNPGVSLYGFRLLTDASYVGAPQYIASVHNAIKGLIEISTQTPDSSYGYGINILNNSYHLNNNGRADTAGYFIDSNWAALTDAFHYANRNKVTMPCAAGNNGANEDPAKPQIDFPAAFDDNWVLAVGGTGFSGSWMGTHTSYPIDESVTSYGPGIDLAAPAADDLIYTDTTDGTWGGFGHENGTSAAAAHVSGVAALLLSYLNDTVTAYKNLTPEDVEYILQRSATYVGYDSATGSGRLNAGNALAIVDTARRKLHHFDSDSVYHYATLAQVQTNVPLRLRERATNMLGQKFDHKFYRANVYKVTCYITLSLGGDSIVSYWTRPSSSDLYWYDGSDSLLPHENVKFETINASTAAVSGYFFHLYDTTSHTWAWLPTDTTNVPSIKFAISVLTGDSIPVWNKIETVKSEHASLSVYPNPANDFTTIEAASDCHESVKIDMYDIQGRKIQPIFSGRLNESRKFTIKTDVISGGVYCVIMVTPCERTFIKFLKL